MNKNYTCCFTGHRPQKLSWGFDEDNAHCIALKCVLKEQIEYIIKKGVSNFITGMAMGTDIWSAEIVLELKRAQNNIKLIAAIPHERQEYGWNENYKMRYTAIRSVVDKEIVLYENYIKGCMQKRNRYMVDNSAYMIAVFNGQRGGTKNTIEYARKKGLSTIVINPNDMSVHKI